MRGEDYGTFLEDRSVTFDKYLAEMPPEFQATGTQNAPYRIIEPGARPIDWLAGAVTAQA